MMDNILSFILEQPGTYKTAIFLKTDNFKLSMMYSGVNTLAINSKIHVGCRVLINCVELAHFNIYNGVFLKQLYENQLLCKQSSYKYEIFTEYLDRELIRVKSPPRTSDNKIIYVK